MPFLIAIITAAGAFYFWTMRARNAADAAHNVIDMANDVRLAARRFGFTKKPTFTLLNPPMTHRFYPPHWRQSS